MILSIDNKKVRKEKSIYGRSCEVDVDENRIEDISYLQLVLVQLKTIEKKIDMIKKTADKSRKEHEAFVRSWNKELTTVVKRVEKERKENKVLKALLKI